MSTKWLEWSQKIQAIAQTGLEFAADKYDRERYEQLREIAVEIMTEYTDHDFEKLHSIFENERGYTTPKLDCRGVIFDDDKVLLVREILDGKWTLPGGWIDVGDTPRQAVEREIFEESGYEAKAIRLLAVYDRGSHPHPPMAYSCYKLFFLCKITGGEAKISMETDGVGFFAIHDLPELSTSRVLPEQIKHLHERISAGILETEFD